MRKITRHTAEVEYDSLIKAIKGEPFEDDYFLSALRVLEQDQLKLLEEREVPNGDKTGYLDVLLEGFEDCTQHFNHRPEAVVGSILSLAMITTYALKAYVNLSRIGAEIASIAEFNARLFREARTLRREDVKASAEKFHKFPQPVKNLFLKSLEELGGHV